MLKWYPQLSRSVIYTLNTSQSNPRRFFAYDHAAGEIEREFDNSDDCGGCYDMSPDGRLLAVKYWHRRGVDIVDFESADVISTFGPSQAWELVFDCTSSRLLVKGRSGLSIFDVCPPHDKTPVANARDISDGSLVCGHNHFLIPSRRRGCLLNVDFNNVQVIPVEIPVPRTARCVRHSPTSETLFVLDSSGTVRCFDSSLKQQFWKTTVNPIPHDGQVVDGAYSGNGQRIGIAVVHDDGCNTVVLDAEGGDVLNTILGVSPGKYPYGEHCTLDPMGYVLNLKTGESSDGFAVIADY